MGLFDFLKKKQKASVAAPNIEEQQGAQKLSQAEKERIMVQRVTIEEMLKIAALPFVWNCNIKKMMKPNSHPFAYIDLTGPNIDIAKQELEKLNNLLASLRKCLPNIPRHIGIPVNKIVFTPQKYHGHTRLMCTPYTFSGKPAQYPAVLSFMTDLSNESTSTHGELFYGQNGAAQKAEVFCWNNKKGYFFYLDSVDGALTISKVEFSNAATGVYAPPSVIYKGPHVLAAESLRAQEETDYQWLQLNFPEQCPKSLSGYRRMKTQNSRNYQSLKACAAELGRSI